MDRIDAMAAFIAVCDADGFAHAARRLGVSPSVITRQIASLEERLGVQLLHRTTRSVGLTETGRHFLERARRIVADVQEAEASAQGEQSEPQGRLSITAPVIFGRIHVAPLLAQLMRLHPRLTTELHVSDRMVNLIEDGHDAAIRIGHLPDSQLIARRVGETRRVLVASPSYLRTAGTPAHPSDLARFDIIAVTGFAWSREWRFVDGDSELRVRVEPRCVTNSGDAAVAYAADGGGLTFALTYQVKAAVASGRLVEVLSGFSPPALPVHAVYPSSRLVSSKVRAFMDLVAGADWVFE
jgi:DNA-binding transcriptional LysR family regulator